MYLHVANDVVELAEHDNFRAFKIVVKGTTADLERARRSLAGVAQLTDSTTGWVSADALSKWPTVMGDPEWQLKLFAMIEKARPHGWIDPQSGAIKAHIEWQHSKSEHSEAVVALLRDGLKLAMRRMASTVTIITTIDDGVPYGMTATSVTSLSMDPPALLVCINKDARIHDRVLGSGTFCVNLLSRDHQPLSGDFSGRKAGQERFQDGGWCMSKAAPPHLPDAQSNIFCDVKGTTPYGTHSIIIGCVTRVLVAERIMPLLHQNGDYGSFARH